MQEINKIKKILSRDFEMKDLGTAKQLLSMRIVKDRVSNTLKLSQDKYIQKVLRKFSIKMLPPKYTYQESFKSLQETFTKDRRRQSKIGKCSIWISNFQIDVCNGMHSARYCSCNRNYQQIHVESEKGALGRNQMAIMLLESNFRCSIMF